VLLPISLHQAITLFLDLWDFLRDLELVLTVAVAGALNYLFVLGLFLGLVQLVVLLFRIRQ
jgi:hypothetical protein